MTKNDKIRQMLDEYLDLATLSDKNYLIGLFHGLIWQKEREMPSEEATSQETS